MLITHKRNKKRKNLDQAMHVQFTKISAQLRVELMSLQVSISMNYSTPMRKLMFSLCMKLD